MNPLRWTWRGAPRCQVAPTPGQGRSDSRTITARQQRAILVLVHPFGLCPGKRAGLALHFSLCPLPESLCPALQPCLEARGWTACRLARASCIVRAPGERLFTGFFLEACLPCAGQRCGQPGANGARRGDACRGGRIPAARKCHRQHSAHPGMPLYPQQVTQQHNASDWVCITYCWLCAVCQRYEPQELQEQIAQPHSHASRSRMRTACSLEMA